MLIRSPGSEDSEAGRPLALDDEGFPGGEVHRVRALRAEPAGWTIILWCYPPWMRSLWLAHTRLDGLVAGLGQDRQVRDCEAGEVEVFAIPVLSRKMERTIL